MSGYPLIMRAQRLCIPHGKEIWVTGINKRILIVGTDNLLCRSLSHALERPGYNILTVPGVLQAAVIVRDQPIDLCILGFQSNDSDTTAHHTFCIRLHKKEPPVPFIIVGCDNSFETEKRARSYGPIYFCNKPVPIGEIVHIIEHVSTRVERVLHLPNQ